MSNRVPMYVRLPRDLHRRLTDLARRERRSLNEQLVRLLETHPDVEAMAMTETTWQDRWARREIDRRQAETEAWGTYVGQQSVREFVSIMQGDGIHDIDEMARQYVANIPAMLDVEADDLPPDLADLLAGYIRRQIDSEARRLANERLLDRRDAIERGEEADFSLSDADLDGYFEFEPDLDSPVARTLFREEWERGAREMGAQATED